jgi:hypothetical protein
MLRAEAFSAMFLVLKETLWVEASGWHLISRQLTR